MTPPDEEETLRLAPEEIDMHRSQLDNRGGYNPADMGTQPGRPRMY